MSEINAGKRPSKLYVDSMVLIYYLKPRYRPSEANCSKRFFSYVERGLFKGIVSTLTLMEMIKVLREILVETENVHDPKYWRQEGEEALRVIYSIKNVQIVEGKHDERPTLPAEEFYFSSLVKNAFNTLRKYPGKTAEDRDQPGSYVHDGLHPMDTLHIALAKATRCDKIATFDLDFDESKAEIPPLNLSRDTW